MAWACVHSFRESDPAAFPTVGGMDQNSMRGVRVRGADVKMRGRRHEVGRTEGRTAGGEVVSAGEEHCDVE